jgi:hypothetical protein
VAASHLRRTSVFSLRAWQFGAMWDCTLSFNSRGASIAGCSVGKMPAIQFCSSILQQLTEIQKQFLRILLLACP